MKQTKQTSVQRLAAAAAVVLLAMAALVGLAGAQPTEANQPDAQITLLANPDFGAILQLLPTATPVPFNSGAILVNPNLNVGPIVTLPPVLTAPTLVPTPQPCGQAITPGKAVTGSLQGNGQFCDYTFAGSAGQVVSITMQRKSGGIDPLIELRDSNGVTLALDDDSNGRLNSQLLAQTLPADETYTVRARSFDPAASGSFQLSVTPVRPATTATSLPGAEDVLCTGSLSYGQTVDGQVPFPGAQCWYTFQGVQGQTAAVYLAGLDDNELPNAWILDPRGRIMQPDNSGAEVAGVPAFALPVTGAYTVVLTDDSDTGTGPFELSVMLQDPCKQIAGYGPQRVPITPDSPVCTFAMLDRPSFFARIQVRAISGDLEPLVQFYGPTGELLHEYVSDGTSQQMPANVASIVIQAADGSSGVVEVQISSGQFIYSQQPCIGSIRTGEFVKDSLTTFSPSCTYYFNGQAGDVVTISMIRKTDATAPDNQLDTFLTLLDPDETAEATDDDGGLPPTNSLIKQHELATSGRYTIVAGSYNDASTGPFYLMFWQHSP